MSSPLVAASGRRAVVDGNEAVARIAHLASEVIAIYPITPASPMGEHADAWSAERRPNLWGQVPEIIELQSEAGAAGTLHGAVTTGALATTFTASQGLLLMLPNLLKIAGELTPAVVHVAARTVATHALSIFGDHSDVMAARTTGMAMLSAASVQQAQDFAAIAHAATLEARVPFLHFFDGFRTSHELADIELITHDQLRDLIDERFVLAHRARGLTPDRPVMRGSAQNPDVFFQAREAANPFHHAVPGVVQATMDRFADLTGRHHHLVAYHGHPQAERVVVLMGSAEGAAREAVDVLVARGERVGVCTVHLYRPFPVAAFVAALPPTVSAVAVMDRTKEPGAPAEPLHLDVLCALAECDRATPRVIGGRWGLSSKEVDPAMVLAVLAELGRDTPRARFTVGITDDVTHLSLSVERAEPTDHARVRAVFYGLGSDGTVGANKNTAKIVNELTGLHTQAYFVYDSKKSGSTTVSHVRFDDEPITATYLIDSATFVGVHQEALIERLDVLAVAAPGATVLVNSSAAPEDFFASLPLDAQRTIVERSLEVHLVDAEAIAREHGLGGRINTVMQLAFFALSDLVPVDDAEAAMRGAVEATYGKRGSAIVERNVAAMDATRERIVRVPVPADVVAGRDRRPVVPVVAPDFVQRVTAMMIAGKGDLLPVSALPVDGTFPTGTTQWERRGIADEVPVWVPELCVDCGKCTIVCPHAAIRMKVFRPDDVDASVRDRLLTKTFRSRETAGLALSIQVAPDDCTGCGVCVEACPAHDKTEVKRKAVGMVPIGEVLDVERDRWDAFRALPDADPEWLDPASVKGSQVRRPLFEFSGACAGCGETPYLKLLTQLFGDRLVVANATGCSSIYGGNLPTTPWATDACGRGPAWSNSLFEDNAEFGLGMRLAFDARVRVATELLAELSDELDTHLVREVLSHHLDRSERAIAAQRVRVERLRAAVRALAERDPADRRHPALLEVIDDLVPRSVWIVGGDGWAYDIGAGGLDHVLGSGRDLNVLVLDTEVYSNTGGQASKATPLAAVAKFAASGKRTGKKDLAMEATTYGDVYVARVAIGANDVQTVKALLEAEAWPGPSLVLAYSTCIAHGIDMRESMHHMDLAVRTGHWPLMRYHPATDEHAHPMHLDSKPPSEPLRSLAEREGRFAMLMRSDPRRAEALLDRAQREVDERWRLYAQLADVERTVGDDHGVPAASEEP